MYHTSLPHWIPPCYARTVASRAWQARAQGLPLVPPHHAIPACLPVQITWCTSLWHCIAHPSVLTCAPRIDAVERNVCTCVARHRRGVGRKWCHGVGTLWVCEAMSTRPSPGWELDGVCGAKTCIRRATDAQVSVRKSRETPVSTATPPYKDRQGAEWWPPTAPPA